ncbi:MAG: ABC transporter permease [Planctomycetota bacterium]|jgi:ribose transport system permease protein|nr:ABC transporter permease [Planctomycetota bacterium]
MEWPLKRTVNTKNIRVLLPSIVVVAVLLIFGATLSGRFISVRNLGSILMTASLLVFATTAQNIVFLSGNNGIDLSIGAVMSMTALVGPMMPIGTPVEFAFATLTVIAMGAVCGLLNGLGIRVLSIPPLIMTLIMSNVIYGFTLFVTKGRPAMELSKILLGVNKTVFPMIRVLTICGVVAVAAAEIILRKTRAGRKLAIVGDNPNAAGLCGLRVSLISVAAYVCSGGIAGFAGFMLVGYAGSAIMRMADSYTLLSVAAAIIGGTSVAGGRGSFVGGALGSLVLILLTSILQMLNIPQGARFVIQGVLLAVILLTNTRSEKLRQ